jgi:hypothetical protein
MGKKKFIAILALLFLAIAALTANLIVAWLTDTAQTGPTKFQLGHVEFTWDGEVSQDLVVPGENIVATDYTLVNKSTIRTELRFKIEIYSEYLDDDGSDYVILTIDDGWVLETDGFYYYRGSDTVVDEDKYKILPETETITVITGIELDGSKVGNDFSSSSFTITLVFEAKQSDYVDWDTLGQSNIDFSTGLPGT